MTEFMEDHLFYLYSRDLLQFEEIEGEPDFLILGLGRRSRLSYGLLVGEEGYVDIPVFNPYDRDPFDETPNHGVLDLLGGGHTPSFCAWKGVRL